MKKKPSEEHARQFAIENALASLLHGNPPEELRPLAEAVRRHDWRAISNAALSFENAARNAEIRAHTQIKWIAESPRAYGLEKLSRQDVQTIAEVIIPEFTWPKDKKTRGELWKKLGLKNEQRHGEEPPALRKWHRAWLSGKVSEYTRQSMALIAAIRSGELEESAQIAIETKKPVEVNEKSFRAVILPTDSGGVLYKILD